MAKTRRFLVIDDEPPVSDLLKTIVERKGGSCDTAVSIRAAAKLMADKVYDVIICDRTLDQSLPGDGENFLTDINDRRADPSAPAPDYLRNIAEGNLRATKVIYSGDYGSHHHTDHTGHKDGHSTEPLRSNHRIATHINGIDRVEIKPGNPFQLVGELMGERIQGAGGR